MIWIIISGEVGSILYSDESEAFRRPGQPGSKGHAPAPGLQVLIEAGPTRLPRRFTAQSPSIPA